VTVEVTVSVAVVFETHSITTDNEAGLATGWLAGRLSEHGRVLATELGRRRRYDGIAAVFASDLGRAVETVERAFGGSGIPVYLDARLREVDYGAWNGMPVSRLEGERARRIRRPIPAARATSRSRTGSPASWRSWRTTGTGHGCCWSATPRPGGPWTNCWPTPAWPRPW
jgi:broad specificity phosphatase PhoE